jgi:hypothetical protein
LALFGRRPLQHAHTLVMAATENLHKMRLGRAVEA